MFALAPAHGDDPLPTTIGGGRVGGRKGYGDMDVINLFWRNMELKSIDTHTFYH